jgi:hypothetical protein
VLAVLLLAGWVLTGLPCCGRQASRRPLTVVDGAGKEQKIVVEGRRRTRRVGLARTGTCGRRKLKKLTHVARPALTAVAG